MFSRSLFHHRQFTRARFILMCALLLIAALVVSKTSAPRSYASSKRQSLTFEDRVAAQRAIEAVYHRHRIWLKDNPQPRPALDQMLLKAAVRAKVEEYLRLVNQASLIDLLRGKKAVIQHFRCTPAKSQNRRNVRFC
jgi:hypothetical protein